MSPNHRTRTNSFFFYLNPSSTDDEAWMQQIAFENNLAETAFVRRIDGDSADSPLYTLRWFTPTTEVDLCGHATLAAAHALHVYY